MGVFMVKKLLSFLWLSVLFLLHTNTFLIIASKSKPRINSVVRRVDVGDIATTSNPPLPPPADRSRPNGAPFRPSIAVIVGVLTTMFSITFLLLLYAKHCKRENGYAANSRGAPLPTAARKNSGIDPKVIDSLPVFRFESLRGQKDGLECAVCLNRLEPSHVLRLLPKCKHAFHVECVDTWLDAHSTCPLCRYRVDPEDILLVDDDATQIFNQFVSSPPPSGLPESELGFRRVSGRYSSAGERGSSFLQIVSQRPPVEESSSETCDPTPVRRSLDMYNSSRKKKKREPVFVGCFERSRKDGLLLNQRLAADRASFERRFEHRIIVSDASSGEFQQRWSDVQPADLLYLRSEMIINNSRRFLSSSRSRQPGVEDLHQHQMLQLHSNREGIDGGWQSSGRNVINSRCVSEITGLSRFSSNNHQERQQHKRLAGLVSRWLAWISQSQPPGESLEAQNRGMSLV